jgi:hypothetical protein
MNTKKRSIQNYDGCVNFSEEMGTRGVIISPQQVARALGIKPPSMEKNPFPPRSKDALKIILDESDRGSCIYIQALKILAEKAEDQNDRFILLKNSIQINDVIFDEFFEKYVLLAQNKHELFKVWDMEYYLNRSQKEMFYQKMIEFTNDFRFVSSVIMDEMISQDSPVMNQAIKKLTELTELA